MCDVSLLRKLCFCGPGNVSVEYVSVADVTVETPDKKSIMTYLMCLFQVLPHAALTSHIEVQPPAPSKLAHSPSPTRSPTSPASETSVSSSSELAALVPQPAKITEVSVIGLSLIHI